MTGEREHLAANPQELDAKVLVPPYERAEVLGILEPQLLHPFGPQLGIPRLCFVWPILLEVLRLIRVLEGMLVVQYR